MFGENLNGYKAIESPQDTKSSQKWYKFIGSFMGFMAVGIIILVTMNNTSTNTNLQTTNLSQGCLHLFPVDFLKKLRQKS